MLGRKRITLAIAFAYVVGFVFGCLVLGALRDRVPVPVSGSPPANTFSARHSLSGGVLVPNKPSRAPVDLRAMRGRLQLSQLTFNVPPGGEVQVAVLTDPGAACTIRFKNTNTVDVLPPELTPLIAGDDGVCSWAWRLANDTPPGVGSLTIFASGVTDTYFFRVE